LNDSSDRVPQEHVVGRLLTSPKTVIRFLPGFPAREILTNIAGTTLADVRAFEEIEPLETGLRPKSPERQRTRT